MKMNETDRSGKNRDGWRGNDVGDGAKVMVQLARDERAALLRIAARYGRTPGEIVRRIVAELARAEGVVDNLSARVPRPGRIPPPMTPDPEGRGCA